MADLDRSANKEMFIETQFSSVAEQPRTTEERCRPAIEERTADRKRALRELEFVGEHRSHHSLGVVTSTEKKEAALRIQLCPPTPNQTSQRNAIAWLFSVFESLSSRG